MRNLNRLFFEIADDEVLLHYEYLITLYWENGKKEIETNTMKHWRQFVKEEYLVDQDMIFQGSDAWLSGMLYDIREQAELENRYLTDLFNNCFLEYSSDLDIGEIIENYYQAAMKWQNYLDKINSLKTDLINLGKSYDYSMMDQETMFAELDTLEKTINDQKVVFETLKDEYFLLGNEFTSTGNNYDAQYIVVKKFYDELENKRFLFEIQDSIRRWASTAYLEAETNDLKKCEESLGRARTVLDVLSNLYSGEKNRPYKNEKYAELYSEYERSFSDLLFSIKAYNILDSFISKEKVRNEKAFAIYQDSLHSLGYVPIFPEKYVSPDDRTEWTIVDMISIKNGMLCFSQDVSGKIKGTEIEKIRDYFNANIIPENGIHSISQFDIALNDLNQRMSGYLKNNSTFSQWALARDYLISTLISKNSDLTFLKDNLYRADLLKSGQSLGSLTYLESPWSERKAVSRYYDNIKGLVLEEQKNAWEKLNEAERADLEFYVIITLSGIGNDYLYGFSQYTSYYDYEKAYKRVNGFYKDARDINNQWWNPGRYFYSEMRSVDKFVAGRIQTTFNQIKDYYDNWKDGLSINITQIESTKKDYDESCIRLCLLDGMSTDNKKISWDDICVSFEITGGLEISELKALENKWNEMIRQTNNSCSKVTGALAELVKWSQALREESRYALENQWINDSLEMQKNENEYFELAGDYIEGIIDKTVLVKAAEKTFGNEAAAWKKHLENIERTLFNDLITYTEHSSEYFVEYCILGFDYVLAITDIYNTKYNKELESRESEWEMQRRDIEKKYLEWQKTVDLILERGRQDWKEGNQRFEDVYKHWYTNFQHEYNSVSDAWADAYLAGMTDKEEWLSRAAIAANEASGEAFLSIIGTEAERLSRVMDMRYPLGIITTDAANEADKILTDLLGRPGIQNLNNAFNVLNGMASLSQPVIRRGMGNGIWDERTIRAAAADLSREINAEFAARETRKLAINIGSLAEEAIQSFSLTVDKANKNFTRNIDDMFIIQGQWRKNGNNYIKDIITGSTFFQPVISKTHEVKGYVNFEMEPFEVKTNFDENYLANLDSYAIMILIENIYAEMDTLTDEIFGIGEEKKIIKKEISENVFKGLVYHNNTVKKEYESVLINLEERHLNPGKFGSHIGYKPATREIKGDVKSRDKMFYDEGSGELGRLLSDFIYWSIIDNQGLALLAVAPWDKPLWDDHGSVFEAPSLRSAAGFTTQVAVTAASIALTPLTAGLSYVGLMGILALVDVGDDLLFSGLDVMCGYKTFDEAGFEFGKALLTSTISSVGSGVFGGVTGSGLTKMAMNTTTDAIGKVAIQSAMVGVQTISTGILTSAVNGVTYNHESGWGYSKEIFDAGLKNSMINGLASTASTFTSGMLKIANSGLDYEKLKGFSVVNQKNVDRLNGLIGSLGGESLKYAFTGDFTLNILNTGLFTNGNFNHGLLELHLGSGDPRMNIGSSGANVSIDNIVGSIQGAMVWNVNNRITRYTEKNDFKEKITLRGQYGFGDKKQKNQLWDILSGRNPILTEKGKDYTAETDIIDGKRTIKIGNYTAGMSDEDQMLLAVVLGHEAYRDGIVSLDNNLETQRAVLGHTEMAIRMVMDGQMMAFNDNLLKDIVEYFYSNGNLDLFNAYVDNNYDSSGDYWRLVKDENGKWDWIEDGDLNFNFDLKDMEISSVLGKRSDLAYTINMKTGIVTIKYSDMTPLFATILGINLGLQDGSKYFTTMVFNKNYALDSFVNKTLNMAETSKDIITQINKQTVMINDLVANKIKYGFEGQQYNEWVVNENSTTMNCVGLVSYLFQTQSLYTVANYGSNPFFERVTTAMPGDLIAFVAYKDTDNGREYNNHIVGWMGSYGPAQGKNDQIYESAFGTGPRFDTLQKLTNFYSKNNYVSEQYIYRFKK
jgi:flagellar motor component MotA